jgi:hypothetical protein
MISMTVYGRRVASFGELVGELPPDAVASPRRSTVPLIEYWRSPQARIDHLWRQLGLALQGSADLHFEYAVPVAGGRGKASFTDLMIIAEGVALGIEAKFTEPPYESVGSWLGPSPTPNRRAVLDGWLGLIGRVVGGPIDADSVRDLPYQLIHRTASVCSVDGPRRHVVYQVFGETPSPCYAEQLLRLAAILGAGHRIGLAVLGCPFRPSGIYRQIVASWDSGERDLGDRLRAALIAGPILDFDEPAALRIQATA